MILVEEIELVDFACRVRKHLQFVEEDLIRLYFLVVYYGTRKLRLDTSARFIRYTLFPVIYFLFAFCDLNAIKNSKKCRQNA